MKKKAEKNKKRPINDRPLPGDLRIKIYDPPHDMSRKDGSILLGVVVAESEPR